VGSVLRVLNATTEEFDLVTDDYVQDVREMDPTITNTFEVGYKGLFAGKFVAAVDVWHSRIRDFVGPLRVETPNVFFNSDDLQAYLAPTLQTQGLTQEQIAALITQIASIPVGTVTPDGTEDPGDLLLTYRNFGDVDLTGVDLACSWYLDSYWTVGVNFSYVNRDFFEDASGISDIALNAPQRKAGGHLSYRNDEIGLAASSRVRYVDGFPVLSGVFVGETDDYTLVDLTASYDLPFSEGTNLSLIVQNLFDKQHREFVGAPEIGRVAILRLMKVF
jgi:iron complex outermembrane receptor protein